MNNIEKSKVLNCLQKMYSFLGPLEPDKNIIKISKTFSELAKVTINIYQGSESYVALGYYSSDIKVNYGHFPSLPYIDILYINMLEMEFISDLLCFSKNRDKEHFLYLFSKYMRYHENRAKNWEAGKFYNWIYSRYSNKPEFNYLKYINHAGLGSYFLLIHELMHTNSKMLESTIKLFKTPPTNIYFNKISEEKTKEVACDFAALACMAQIECQKKFNITENEMLEIALLQIFAIGLFPLLSGLLISNINNKKSNINNKTSKLFDVTNNRFQYLMYTIKTAKNGKMFFSDVDISSVFDNTTDVVLAFLNNIAKFLENDLIAETEIYNSMIDDEKEKFSIPLKFPIWSFFC